jgi:hypothetical protein
MEKARTFTQHELEEVYAMWFRGYDNVSTLLNRLETKSENDKRAINAVKHLMDEMDNNFYQFFKPE